MDGVVTVVDGDALAQGQLVGDLDALEAQRQADESLDHETPIEELFADQLACADLVLLTENGCDGRGGARSGSNLASGSSPAGVKVVPCHQGEIAPELLLGFNAAVEDNLEQRPSHHDHEEEHEHDDEMNSVCVALEQTFDPKTLVAHLQTLVQAQEIYRIKGFVAVPNKAMRLVLQGVGQRFDTFYDRPWQPSESRQTRLVFIGHDLKAEQIKQAVIA